MLMHNFVSFCTPQEMHKESTYILCNEAVLLTHWFIKLTRVKAKINWISNYFKALEFKLQMLSWVSFGQKSIKIQTRTQWERSFHQILTSINLAKMSSKLTVLISVYEVSIKNPIRLFYCKGNLLLLTNLVNKMTLLGRTVWLLLLKQVTQVRRPWVYRASDISLSLIIFAIFGPTFVSREEKPGHFFAC